MPGVEVSEGATVEYAIVAERAKIGKNCKVGQSPDETEPDEWGISVIGPEVKLSDDTVICAREMIKDSEAL